MSSREKSDSPQVLIPPPLIVLGFVGLGFGLDKLLQPAPLAKLPWTQTLGWGLIMLALSLIVWSMMTYRYHKTSIMPHSPDQTLITGGPFRFSRNPIYLAFIILQIGFAFIFNAQMVLVTVIGSYLALRYYVIAKEEAYLERQFLEPYVNYKGRVRRWI